MSLSLVAGIVRRQPECLPIGSQVVDHDSECHSFCMLV